MDTRDLFISHSSDDADAARELRTELEAAGYTCWMAPDDIVGTQTWTEQILHAIESSKAMIVLVSTAANASPHVSREVNLALGKGRAVLPIRIEAVPPEGSLEYLLSLVQRIDAFPPPIANHRDRILRRIATIVERHQADAETQPHEVAAPGAEPTAKPPRARRGSSERPPRSRRRTEPAASAAEAPEPASSTADPAEDDATASAGAGAATQAPTAASPAPAGPEATRTRPTRPGQVGPGSVIGAFTVETLLGEGGMATVYRARQDEPKRMVALKVIRADHAADETYRKRFLAEKDTLAALEHPSIVPIYAAGDADGILYIAMRLVDGPDLQVRIGQEGRLSLRETIDILEPIADAVDYAHSMGVVHRDLKPSNVILDRDGRPYLTDFGLGKRLEVSTQVSMPGVAVGTLDYMAPEQFTGSSDASLAPRIDLYALACVAFTCLTGQAPFVRDTPEQLMYAHAHEPPPSLRSRRPEYPEALDAVFVKALAKDPKARYETARAFVAAMDDVVRSATAGQTVPVAIAQDTSAAGRARRWVGANTMLAVGGGAVALVLVVALAAAAVFGPPKPSAAPTQAAFSTLSPTLPPITFPPITVPPITVPPVTAAPTADTGAFPNTFERQLLDLQPSVVVRSTCKRYEPKYVDALAMIVCDGPKNGTEAAKRAAFFALFEDPDTMQSTYEQIMSNAGIAATTTGCFDLVQSNNGWQYTGGTNGSEGSLGCYPRTEDTFNGIQYVWTYDVIDTMGLWLSPGYQDGLNYFNTWVTGAKPG